MADTPAPEDPAQRAPDLHNAAIGESLERYWVRNVRIMAWLTLCWLLVGVGCGILLADRLNALVLPGTGYPLGFWFAQQGSILGFVLIILVYCLLMNKLDARHHRELEELRERQRDNS